jgi:hypothetical protein
MSVILAQRFQNIFAPLAIFRDASSGLQRIRVTDQRPSKKDARTKHIFQVQHQ